MRAINLLIVYISLLLSSVVGRSTTPEPDSVTETGAVSYSGDGTDAHLSSDITTIFNEESMVVHAVFRALRSELAAMNSLLENLKVRRSGMKKKDHPEVLAGISRLVDETKTALSKDVRSTKNAKKLLRKAGTFLTQDHAMAIELVKQAHSVILACIDDNVQTIKFTKASLENKRVGVHSRKERLSAVIGDIPDRLESTLLKFESIIKRVSDVTEAIKIVSSPTDV